MHARRAQQACAIQRGKALLATGAREEAAAVLEGAAARAASLELLVHEVTPPARCVCWARLRILQRWHVAKPRGAWSPWRQALRMSRRCRDHVE